MGLSQAVSTDFMRAGVQVSMDHGRLQTLEGTLQRVDYRGQEMTVVAHGQLWEFRLDIQCQFWFDNQRAILRCFHPLDRVRVDYENAGIQRLAKALYSWD